MALSLTARMSVGVLAFMTASVSGRADEATVAAGAGFRRPIAEIATLYEKSSGHKVLQVYGHLGQVIAQARESGRIQLVCGDRVVLDDAKGLSFDRMERLGLGKLVVAYRKDLNLLKPADLTRPDVKRVGIPDQANAIYGRAGRQLLDRSKLADAISAKLIVVATVPQVTSYIVSGEVDAGFINATDAIGAGANIGGFIEVDPALYEPVEVACGLLTAGKTSAAADGFVRFLATEPARAVLQRYGL